MLSILGLSVKNRAFHACYEDESTRKQLLRLLAKTKLKIVSIRIDKQYFCSDMSQSNLYLFLTHTLLSKCLEDGILRHENPTTLIASRLYTSKKLNSEFIQSLASRKELSLNIYIKAPHAEKGLQAVDCASWSLYQKYEHRNPKYADIITCRISHEYILKKINP